MTLVKRNLNAPFFNEWFDDFFAPETNPMLKNRISSVPKVNIFETDSSYKIELAVPGIKKEDVKINLNNELLTIFSEKSEEQIDEKKTCTKREYSYSSFSRSFTLPEAADKEKITAKCENGILVVTIEKREEKIVKPIKNIEIN